MLPAQLVTIAGGETVRDIMHPQDYATLTSGYCTAGEVKQLEDKYPELMGIFPLFTALIPAAAKAGKAILKNRKIAAAISKFKTKKPEEQPAPAPAQVLWYKNPLIIGGGIAALAAIVLLTRGKK